MCDEHVRFISCTSRLDSDRLYTCVRGLICLLAGSQIQIYSGKPRPIDDSLGDGCRRANGFPEGGSIKHWLVLHFCPYSCGDIPGCGAASVYTEMNAISKGVSLGIFESSRNNGMEAAKGGSQPYVNIMGRRSVTL